MVSGLYNVVLVIIDTLRWDHVGCLGGLARTPNIDRLCREGVVFTRAYPESLPTIPVRRAIYTGRRVFPFRDKPLLRRGIPWIKMAGWQPIPDEDTTLAEFLKGKGYRTALIGDNYHIFEPGMNFNRGFDEWVFIRGQEWDHYKSLKVPDEVVNRYLTPSLKGTGVEGLIRRYLANVSFRRSEEDWFPALTFREAVRWLSENRDADRFLLLIESFDPHEPWDPPHEFVEMYDPGYSGPELITPKYGSVDYLSERELRHMRAHYAGEVTLVDKWFGYFMQKFYELNLDKNTILILISDHGHQLGEHGLTGKVAWGLYPELVDIPLIIRHPEYVNSGIKVNEFTYDHDLFPTICSLIGVDCSGLSLSGLNIWDYVEGKGSVVRGYVTSAFGNYVMYRDDEYWLISDRGGSNTQLYDLKSDPVLKRNIAGEAIDKVKELFSRIINDAGGRLEPLPTEGKDPYEWYNQLYVM